MLGFIIFSVTIMGIFCFICHVIAINFYKKYNDLYGLAQTALRYKRNIAFDIFIFLLLNILNSTVFTWIGIVAYGIDSFLVIFCLIGTLILSKNEKKAVNAAELEGIPVNQLKEFDKDQNTITIAQFLDVIVTIYIFIELLCVVF